MFLSGTNHSNPTEQYWSQGSSPNQPLSSDSQDQQQHPALMLATNPVDNPAVPIKTHGRLANHHFFHPQVNTSPVPVVPW